MKERANRVRIALAAIFGSWNWILAMLRYVDVTTEVTTIVRINSIAVIISTLVAASAYYGLSVAEAPFC